MFGADDAEPMIGGVTLSHLAKATKIYYCSRTHSQISQFIHEIESTVFAATKLRVVSLGSRKHLCINSKVNRPSSSVAEVNDRCRDARGASAPKPSSSSASSASKKRKRASASSTKRCPYYQTQAESAQSPDSSQALYTLAEIRDIEDTVKMGNTLMTCPYYASRRAVVGAHVVALPYSMLVHKDTRESLGIDLSGAIVIVDEAHNLVDAVTNVYSESISLTGLRAAVGQLNAYFERYQSRLSGDNRVSLMVLLNVTTSLEKWLANSSARPKTPILLSPNSFLHDAGVGIDHFNPFEMAEYADRVQLHNKLLGFIQSLDSEENNDDDGGGGEAKTSPRLSRGPSSPLRGIISFLQALNEPQAEAIGRVLVVPAEKNRSPRVEFVVLDPSLYFRPLLQDAMAVFLAGGTMQPFDDVLIPLLGMDPSIREAHRVSLFSCGHVVAPDRVLTLCVGSPPSGTSGTPFKFTYGNRSKLIPDLTRVLTNYARVTRGGVVVFFPSYAYEAEVMEAAEAALSKVKPVFREASGSTGDNVLRGYSAAVEAPGSKGAILSCVMGGKMSEGINFSNDLGRLVVVVGVPYPPPDDVVINAKIQLTQGNKSDVLASMCMKTVNQSIGRAIRHVNDYAAIALLDVRYHNPNGGLASRLPSWIMRQVVYTGPGTPNNVWGTPSTFGSTVGALARFFKSHQPPPHT